MVLLAHVERFAVVDRRHDVPGGAAVGHEVEGGEAPRHVERLEIGGRAGRGEAELCRDHAHRGQHDRSGPSSRSGCRIRRYARGRCRSGPAWRGDRRRTPCGTCRLRESGRSPGSSRPTWNRRAIPDAATNSADWCSSGPAGSRPTPFAVSCCSPCQARSSSRAILYSPASARSFSHVASSISMPFLRRSCSRRYSTSPG